MTDENTIPYLSGNTLQNLGISTFDIIECIEKLIRGSAEKTVWSAPKATILPEDGRYMMAALAAADEPALLAVKTVVLNPKNTARGLPQINGLVTMLNSQTGLPVAILDGNWITAVRTAGLSATAAKYMARKNASVVAFIGTGVQASSHLVAFKAMFPLSEVRIFGRGQTNIDKLADEAKQCGLASTVCGSGEEVVDGADLIVSSVTFSKTLTPFLDANWLKAGSFTAVTDLSAPWKQETYSAFDRISIDDLQQEAALPNKISPPEYVSGDLSGLVMGKISGREQDNERTAFVFRGHAMGDLALSILAYEKSLIKSQVI